jgi:TRAP-type C4-dicarboxylate transport system substrate-binding protein
VVGLSIGALMAIFSSQTWGPIRKLEDMRGARIRSLPPIDRCIEALGAKPLHVDYLEIQPQLARGELDATVLGLLPAKMFKLAENGAPYCTLIGGLSITMHPMRTYVKWNSWNKLAPEIKAVINELGPSGRDCWFAIQSGLDADSVLRDALDYFQQKGEIIRLSSAEQDRWIEAMRPQRLGAVELAESVGQPGRRFFARMLELAGQLAHETELNSK